jgi:trk system potassium uptake protein TrkA
MKIVVVGCGRVGASSAELWDKAGHEVIVLDMSTRAFERLPSSFGGSAVRGDGTDEDVLRRAGIEGADIFLALTEGDNRNVMAAQLATEALGIQRVIAKINDPVRSKAYAELGISTVCRTGLMIDSMNAFLGFPPSGLAGMLGASGHDHPTHDAAGHSAAGHSAAGHSAAGGGGSSSPSHVHPQTDAGRDAAVEA